jgi:wyosine [tRNA(Phe)-imidazoG37] synthetase (radical SAM superfamily)
MEEWRTIQGNAVTFGPVPSRRLGQSLGINNIPPKICSYSCVYCQLGRTPTMQTERGDFYHPEQIFENVRERVKDAERAGGVIDFLSFVPDGEPTLDRNLGREIELIRELGVEIAVITNASLVWRKDVRDDLADADWVSLKVDAVRDDVWRRVDRPHGRLRLSRILDGMLEFAESFSGRLVTETMLVEGVNDSDELLEELSEYLARPRLRPPPCTGHGKG